MKLIQIHPNDNVAVALEDIRKGEEFLVSGTLVKASEDIGRGHKIALQAIGAGQPVIKYGNPIGFAKEDIEKGSWVHVHNVRTGLSESVSYVYRHQIFPPPKTAPRTFLGYRREDGRAAVRNEIWIIPTVGCVNSVIIRTWYAEVLTDSIPFPIPTDAVRWEVTTRGQKSFSRLLSGTPTPEPCWCSAWDAKI